MLKQKKNTNSYQRCTICNYLKEFMNICSLFFFAFDMQFFIACNWQVKVRLRPLFCLKHLLPLRWKEMQRHWNCLSDNFSAYKRILFLVFFSVPHLYSFFRWNLFSSSPASDIVLLFSNEKEFFKNWETAGNERKHTDMHTRYWNLFQCVHI